LELPFVLLLVALALGLTLFVGLGLRAGKPPRPA
jgi:hypothetical protein